MGAKTAPPYVTEKFSDLMLGRVKLVLFLETFYYVLAREILNQSFLRELCMIYYLPRGLASAAEFLLNLNI